MPVACASFPVSANSSAPSFPALSALTAPGNGRALLAAIAWKDVSLHATRHAVKENESAALQTSKFKQGQRAAPPAAGLLKAVIQGSRNSGDQSPNHTRSLGNFFKGVSWEAAGPPLVAGMLKSVNPRSSEVSRALPPLVAGMLKSVSPRSCKLSRALPRPRESGRMREISEDLGLTDSSIPATNGGPAAFPTVSCWNA